MFQGAYSSDMLRLRRMADTPDQNNPTSRDAPEKDAVQKPTDQKPTGQKPTGMTRKGFGLLLKRAFTPDAAKSDQSRSDSKTK
jgi:hypothetical protein